MRNYYVEIFLTLFLFSFLHLNASISTSYSLHEIDAVIFDCDGVLVDTEYLKFLAWQEALASKGISFTIEEYMPLAGYSSKIILHKISQSKNCFIPEEVITFKNARYKILHQQGVVPIKEMVAFAKRFSEEKEELGIKLGLASSASMEEIILNLTQVGLENAFDLMISADDLDNYIDTEGKKKPKPYIYLEAAKRLDVQPAKCIVFEDTAAGVEAAVAAGMIAIAVPNRFTLEQDFSKATQIIHSYDALPVEEFFAN